MEFCSKDVQMAGVHGGEEPSREAAAAALPALLIKVPSRSIAGFDCVGRDATVSINEVDEEEEEEARDGNGKDIVISIPAASPANPGAGSLTFKDYAPPHVPYAVSLSMPASPSGFHLSQFRAPRVAPAAEPGHDVHTVAEEEQAADAQFPQLMRQTRFHSQPILHPASMHHPAAMLHPAKNEETRRYDSIRDKRFDPFKTFSGRLERQLSNLRGRPQDPSDGVSPEFKISEEETDQVPAADRYFDALEGPELDTLRVSN